jgi:hypothetical protein
MHPDIFRSLSLPDNGLGTAVVKVAFLLACGGRGGGVKFGISPSPDEEGKSTVYCFPRRVDLGSVRGLELKPGDVEEIVICFKSCGDFLLMRSMGGVPMDDDGGGRIGGVDEKYSEFETEPTFPPPSEMLLEDV